MSAWSDRGGGNSVYPPPAFRMRGGTFHMRGVLFSPKKFCALRARKFRVLGVFKVFFMLIMRLMRAAGENFDKYR